MVIKGRKKKYKARKFLQAQAKMSLHHVFISRETAKAAKSSKQRRTTNEKMLDIASSNMKGMKKPISDERERRGWKDPIDFHYYKNCITFFDCNLKISFHGSYYIFFLKRIPLSGRRVDNVIIRLPSFPDSSSTNSPMRWGNNFPVNCSVFSRGFSARNERSCAKHRFHLGGWVELKWTFCNEVFFSH